jgi:uncharacterized protein (UPF0548 family)
MRKRRPSTPADFLGVALSYPEVAATAGPLPAGYHHTHRAAVLGRGRAVFDAAAGALAAWSVHRRAGLGVEASHPTVEHGAVVVVRIRYGGLSLLAPCRVVSVVDEPKRWGFAYGTVRGHPESGEEAFVVTLAPDGNVEFTITAFSRPATPLARLGGPLTRWLQRRATEHYIEAMRALVASATR